MKYKSIIILYWWAFGRKSEIRDMRYIKLKILNQFLYINNNDNRPGMLMFLDEFKLKIVDALSRAASKPKWEEQFKTFGLVKFVINSDDAYKNLEFCEILDGSGLSSIYYWNSVNTIPQSRGMNYFSNFSLHLTIFNIIYYVFRITQPYEFSFINYLLLFRIIVSLDNNIILYNN